MIYSAYLSFTDYDVINDPNFIGSGELPELFDDPKIALALSNTFFFTVIQVPLYVIVVARARAAAQRAGRASGFFRTVFFLPKMTPPVAVGILFLLLFNGQNGLINTVLGWFGIDGPAWTTDPSWIKPGLILMSLWTVGGLGDHPAGRAAERARRSCTTRRGSTAPASGSRRSASRCR